MAAITREIEGGEVKAFPKITGTSTKMTVSQDDTDNSQRAIPAPKKKRKRTKKPSAPPVDVTPETIPSESQQHAIERTETDSPREQISVLSEPVEATGQQETTVELGYFRSKTERKDSPKKIAQKYHTGNGFIKWQIQTVMTLMFKAVDAETRSFQNVLAELRSTKIGNSLPSPTEILHGRSLVTGSP